MVTGGFTIDLARRNLPEGAFLDAISEASSYLPDTIQLLTPCTIGNGWLRVVDTGRFALALFEKYGGVLKLTPKREQDTKRLLRSCRRRDQAYTGWSMSGLTPNIWGNIKRAISACARGSGNPSGPIRSIPAPSARGS
jgi:hypothetical protein